MINYESVSSMATAAEMDSLRESSFIKVEEPVSFNDYSIERHQIESQQNVGLIRTIFNKLKRIFSKKRETEDERFLKILKERVDLSTQKLLGQGHFGEIRQVSREHVVKILFNKKQPEILDLEEGEALGLDLDHKNILKTKAMAISISRRELKYISSNTASGLRSLEGHTIQCILLPLAEQGSLENLQQKLGTLPIEHAARIIAEVGEGIFYLHNQQIFHRDIKPANILLDKDFTPKIADFGLAISSYESNLTEIAGTPFYMPAESFKKGVIMLREKGDFWALGIVAFKIATGVTPFESASKLPQLIKDIKDFEKEQKTYMAPGKLGDRVFEKLPQEMSLVTSLYTQPTSWEPLKQDDELLCSIYKGTIDYLVSTIDVRRTAGEHCLRYLQDEVLQSK